MDKKTRKRVRRKISIPERIEDAQLPERIRDAVNVLKRFESPEVIREVNQVATPSSCPAYPNMRKYLNMRLTGTRSTSEGNSKAISPVMIGKTPSYKNLAQPPTPPESLKTPRKSRKSKVVKRPQQISLASYLKATAMDPGSSKKPVPGKYKVKNQKVPRKERNGQKPLRNHTKHVPNKNKRIYTRVDKYFFTTNQKEPSTAFPVQEIINKKSHLPKYRSFPKTYCPGCMKNQNQQVGQSVPEKRGTKKNISTDTKNNPLTYFLGQGQMTLHRNNEKVGRKKEDKSKRKFKKKKKVIEKPLPHDENPDHRPIIRKGQTPQDISWSKADIKTYQVGVGKSDSQVPEPEQDPPPSLASQSETMTPTIVPIGSPGGGGEVSYRMCKNCPLRQLISKIDPSVGKDKKSYPVVAFTCCRKGPVVRSISTSTTI